MTLSRISDAAVVTSPSSVNVNATSSSDVEALAYGGGLSLLASAGAAIAGNILIVTANAQVGAAASIDAPKNIEVVANNTQNLAAQGLGGGGGLILGVAASVNANVDTAVTTATVLPLAMLNQGAHVAGLDYSGQRIDVLANSPTQVEGVAGSAGLALVAGAAAAVNAGLIVKDTLASLSGTASATTDVRVAAESSETSLAISIAIGFALGLTVSGSVAIYIVAPQTQALITAATVTAGDNVLVSAHDSNELALVAGSFGASLLASAGAAVEVVAVIKTTTAGIALSTVTAGGAGSQISVFDGSASLVGLSGVDVQAVSTDSLVLLGYADGSSGLAAVNGVVTATAIVNLTTASVAASTINMNNSSGQVKVFAWDNTTTGGVANAMSSADVLATVGAGIDGGVIVKTTQAFIGLASTINSKGDVNVGALSHETITSIEIAGATGSSLVAVAGSVGAYVVLVVTRAFIGNPIAGPPNPVLTASAPDTTHVIAQGNVIVNANESLDLNIIGGGVATGGLAVGAAPQVAVVTKITQAYVGSGVTVTALGAYGAEMASDGTIKIDETHPDPALASNERPPSAANTGSTVLDKVHNFLSELFGIHVSAPGAMSGTDVTTATKGKGQPNTDPTLTNSHQASANASSVIGLAVTATNTDLVATVGLVGAGGYGAAAAVSGGLVVYTALTGANVDLLAQVNPAGDCTVHNATGGACPDANSGQSVLISASNDFFRLGLVLAASVGGLASATVGASLTIAVITTTAAIGDGARVNANGDVLVLANSTQKVITITVGAAVAGLVGVGGGIAVLVLVSATHATIGTLALTRVVADGNVLASANDGTVIVTVIGNAAVGGLAAVGASAGLTVIVKDTRASVGALAQIDAKGNDPIAGIYTGEIGTPWPVYGNGNCSSGDCFRGLAVQATSGEDIYNVILTGSGAGLVGVGASVSLSLLEATTAANIGSGAQINQGTSDQAQDTKGTDSRQSVQVTALGNDHVFAFAGGLAIGGIAGVGGGIDVGIMLDNTCASIDGLAAVLPCGPTVGALGARVSAAKDVNVKAGSIKSVQSVGLAVGAGAVGLGASVSLWAIGSSLLPTYLINTANNNGSQGNAQSGNAINTSDLASNVGGAASTLHGLTASDGPLGGSNIMGLLSGHVDLTGLLTSIGKTVHLGDLTGAVTGAVSDVTGAATGPNSPFTLLTNGITSSLAPSALDPNAPIAATVAFIGDGANVSAGASVSVHASDQVNPTVVVGANGGGFIGVGASISILNIGAKSNATIGLATIRAGPLSGNQVLVQADHTSTVIGASFAGSGAVIGLGAQVLYVQDTSGQHAAITDGATIIAANAVKVIATSDRTFTPVLVGISVGGIVAGVSAAVVIAGGTTSATVGAANIGKSDTVGSLTVTATGTVHTTPTAIGITAGGIAITGTLAVAIITPTVQAILTNANFTVTGDVTIKATSIANINANAAGFTGGFGAVGASIAYVKLNPTITAALGMSGSDSVGGNISVTAWNNYSLAGPTGDGAHATVVAGAGGVVAAVGAVAFVEANAHTTASLTGSTSVTAGGTISVTAQNSSVASSTNVALAVGLVGAGISYASATASPTTQATLTSPGVQATSVTVTSQSADSAPVIAFGLTGGVLAGSGAVGNSTVDPTVSAGIGSGSTISAGSTTVQARATPNATASATGVVLIAAAGLGVSITNAEASPTITASVGDNTSFSGSSATLHVTATRALPNGTDANASATSFAGSGGLLIGGAGAISNVTGGGSVNATAGQNVHLPAGGVSIVANDMSSQQASATGVGIGFIGVGVANATTTTGVTTQATLGSGAITASGRTAAITVMATGHDDSQASATAGSGGVIAGDASSAATTDTSSATASVGDNSTLNAGAVNVTATHTSAYLPVASSVNIAVIGGSGAAAASSSTASANASIGSHVTINAGGAVTITAANNFGEDSISGSGPNAVAAAGGVANGSAGSATTSFTGTANVTVGDHTNIIVTSTVLGLDGILIIANNLLGGGTKVDLNTGGALAGAVVDAELTAGLTNTVNVGANDTFNSTGNIGVGTYTTVATSTQADVSTFGLAAVGSADAHATVTSNQTVSVGNSSSMMALGNVTLSAGNHPNGDFSTTISPSTSAQGYVRGLIAIPLASASSHVTSNTNLNIGSSDQISSGQNIVLQAAPGMNSPQADGTGHGYELGFIPVTDGSSDAHTTTSSNVNDQGTVTAGIFRTLNITIPNDGSAGGFYSSTVNFNPDAAPFTMSYNGSYNPTAVIQAALSGPNQQDLQMILLSGVSSTPVGALLLQDLYASGGSVQVQADHLSGGGTVTAYGGPTITVLNNSPDYLVIGGAMIPNLAGGTVLFTGADQNQSNAITVNRVDEGKRGVISVHNTFLNPVGSSDLGPAIFITGTILNQGGAVSLINDGGSIAQFAPIDAAQVTIKAPNGVYVVSLTPPNPYFITDPSAEWDTFMIWPGGDPNTAGPGAFGAGSTAGNNAAAYAANAQYNALGFYTSADSLTANLIGHAGNTPPNNVATVVYGDCVPFTNLGNCNGSESSQSPAIGSYGGNQNYNVSGDGGPFPKVPFAPLHKTSVDYTPANLTGPQSSGIQALAVAIQAVTVDIDAPIVSGTPTNQSVSYSAGLGATLAAYRAAYLAGMQASPTLTIGTTTTGVATVNMGDTLICTRDPQNCATYDARTNQITVPRVRAASLSSTVLLSGGIISTNPDAHIHVNGGLGQVTINNQTGIDLVLQNIYAGAKSLTGQVTSVVDIADTYQPDPNTAQTLYLYNPDGNVLDTYKGNINNTIAQMEALTPVGTAVTNATTYNPLAGQRFQWQLDASLHRTITTDDSSTFSIGNWVFNQVSGQPNNPWQYVQANGTDAPNNPYSKRVMGAVGGPAFQEDITGTMSTGYGWTVHYHGCDDGSCNYGFAQTGSNDPFSGGGHGQDFAEYNYNYATSATLRLTVSVKADNAIPIDFSGSAHGSVVVNSNAPVVLTGTITNPDGSTTINANGQFTATPTGKIDSGNLTIDPNGIGTPLVPIPIAIAPGGVVNLTGGPDGVYVTLQTDAQLGTVSAGSASSGYGDVVINAAGSLTRAAGLAPGTVNISGRNITLTSANGAVGSTSNPLVIDAHPTVLANGGRNDGTVNVTALLDIGLTQSEGDLSAGSIVSKAGNVFLGAAGSILDARNETSAQALTAAQLAQINADLHLTDSNYQAGAFDSQINTYYGQYWRLLNNGTVSGGTYSLNSPAIGQFRSDAAAALHTATPTDAQVVQYAAYLYSATVAFFNNVSLAASLGLPARGTPLVDFSGPLLGSGWQTSAAFTAFDANFTFLPDCTGKPAGCQTLSTAQANALMQDNVWTLHELQYAIDGAALGAGGTPVGAATPNVVGRNVTFNAGGSVGRLGTPVDIAIADLRTGTLTNDQIAALSLATVPGDILLTGTDSHGAPIKVLFGSQPAGFTLGGIEITVPAPMFVAASTVFNATATNDVYAQSTLPDLPVGAVNAGRAVTLIAPEHLLSAGTAPVQVTAGGDLNLLAGTGDILASESTPSNPFVISATGTVVSIQAGQRIRLKQVGGDLNYERIRAGADAVITVTNGGMFQLLSGLSLFASSLTVTASGAVGKATQPITIQLASGGTLTVDAGGSVFVTQPGGTMNVNHVLSSNGDATLSAGGAILDANPAAPIDVGAANITLTAGTQAAIGGIGTPADFLRINVNALRANPPGVLNAFDTSAASTPGVFVTQPTGDLTVDTVTTTANVTLATSAGSILDGRNGGVGLDSGNVVGNTIALSATGGSIGKPNGANDLKLFSSHGPACALPPGGFAGSAPCTIAAQATGSIDLAQAPRGPPSAGAANILLLQSQTGDIRFTVRSTAALGEDLNLVHAGSALFAQGTPTAIPFGFINAPNGSILLRVADNMTTDPAGTSQIVAGRNITIYGAFARQGELSGGIPITDPGPAAGYGTVIHLYGSIAPGSYAAGGYQTQIFGNSGNDTFTLDHTLLGGRTRVYGSNTPTPAGQFASGAAGVNTFNVIQLQSMPGIASGNTLTLDGQAGNNTYDVYTAGSQSPTQNNYVINVLPAVRLTPAPRRSTSMAPPTAR